MTLAQSLEIVLDLAEQNLCDEHEMPEEYQRQQAALFWVHKLYSEQPANEIMKAAAPRTKIAVYLDQDCNGNDLLDNVGNPITSGWYLYEWPWGEPTSGPFGSEQDATKAGWVG